MLLQHGQGTTLTNLLKDNMKEFITLANSYTMALVKKITKEGDGAGSYTIPTYVASKEFKASGGDGACVVKRGYTSFYHDADGNDVTIIVYVKAVCTPGGPITGREYVAKKVLLRAWTIPCGNTDCSRCYAYSNAVNCARVADQYTWTELSQDTINQNFFATV